eukprot:TRINITY_DN90163_c0_g1_i1.p1 TRINITY_DN90163_c0_g1~~TRINITY_DN90163_c0_g1_i1.p1  ORF type:complete len:518 (-),score=56.30 TRINITY_DN90163_c0_g1_i1:58-1584(-)
MDSRWLGDRVLSVSEHRKTAEGKNDPVCMIPGTTLPKAWPNPGIGTKLSPAPPSPPQQAQPAPNFRLARVMPLPPSVPPPSPPVVTSQLKSPAAPKIPTTPTTSTATPATAASRLETTATPATPTSNLRSSSFPPRAASSGRQRLFSGSTSDSLQQQVFSAGWSEENLSTDCRRAEESSSGRWHPQGTQSNTSHIEESSCRPQRKGSSHDRWQRSRSSTASWQPSVKSSDIPQRWQALPESCQQRQSSTGKLLTDGRHRNDASSWLRRESSIGRCQSTESDSNSSQPRTLRTDSSKPKDAPGDTCHRVSTTSVAEAVSGALPPQPTDVGPSACSLAEATSQKQLTSFQSDSKSDLVADDSGSAAYWLRAHWVEQASDNCAAATVDAWLQQTEEKELLDPTSSRLSKRPEWLELAAENLLAACQGADTMTDSCTPLQRWVEFRIIMCGEETHAADFSKSAYQTVAEARASRWPRSRVRRCLDLELEPPRPSYELGFVPVHASTLRRFFK